MIKRGEIFRFIKTHKNMTDVLADHGLASLGDTYINFVCSLALSNRRGKPSAVKVKGSVLSEALKRAKIREFMPSRINRHVLADAAEALIVYAWLHNCMTLEENVEILERAKDPVEGLSQLLLAIKGRIKFS